MNGAVRTGGGKSKPSGFKKQGDGAFDTVTVKPGDNSVMLKNIKQLASNYGTPKQAQTIITDPKRPSKQILANLKAWGSDKVTSGDNPFKGK